MRKFASFLLSLLLFYSHAHAGEATVKFRFVAITDTHIAAPEHLAKFRSFVYTIKKKLDPDFMVMLGDDCGHAPEYLPLMNEVILQSGLKVHLVAGNHDDNYAKNPEWFQSVFGRMFYSFDYKDWHFVMNWSQKLPMEWLSADLASVAAGTPVVLCQHYAPNRPPLPEDEVAKQEPWATLLKKDGPKLWLTGHTHTQYVQKIKDADSHTLDQWFFQDEKDVGEYAIVEALSDGTARIQHIAMNTLTLEEPADKVPEVAITDPLDGATMSSATTFKGTASDDKSVSWVSYQIDSGAWLPANGTSEWSFTLNPKELAEGHHTVRVRAFDSAGQGTIFIKQVLICVEAPAAPNQIVLQQGRNGYTGCRDVTVRKQNDPKKPDGTDGENDDLETWLYISQKKGGTKELEEFSEFYIRFDLSAAGVKPEAKIKNAKLVLYGSRQNQIDVEGKRCKYGIGVVPGAWTGDMTFATRPEKPAWLAAENAEPKPVIAGTWPSLGGMQMVWPPKPVEIDLAPIKDTVQEWIAKPETNHGLVFSPLFGKAYNMSFKSSRCKYASLRPKLVIELQP